MKNNQLPNHSFGGGTKDRAYQCSQLMASMTGQVFRFKMFPVGHTAAGMLLLTVHLIPLRVIENSFNC